MIGTQLKDFPKGFHELLQRSEGQETYVKLRELDPEALPRA